MADIRADKRKLHALRKHIDELLEAGAVIRQREPLTLLHGGQTLRVKHGMLVSHNEFPDLVDPIADHEWPDALRQMAVELCLRQLDQALQAAVEEAGQRPATQDHATLRPAESATAIAADRNS